MNYLVTVTGTEVVSVQFGEGEEGGKGADDIDMDIDRKELAEEDEPGRKCQFKPTDSITASLFGYIVRVMDRKLQTI